MAWSIFAAIRSTTTAGDIVIKEGQQFRMLDENDEVRYTGWIHGNYTGREPLEEYGGEKGCVRIELEHDGEWIPVQSPNT